MSGMNLMLGNCLERMREIPHNSIDLTVTSPPYDNLRTYNGNNELWSEDVWKEVIKNLYLRAKPGGVVVWVVGDATVNGSETGTSFKQALYAKECGFNIHDTMIYSKPNFSAVGALKVRYAPVFEYMFVWSKGKPKTFNPIKDRKNKTFGAVCKSPTIRGPKGDIIRNKTAVIKEYGQRFNIWEYAPNSKGLHPAPFPDSLAEDHIKSWSNKGDIILDPFMGSGTTGVAAKKLGRDFIGIEILPPEQQRAEYERIKQIRKDYKPINYAAVYGAMPKRVSRETGMSQAKAKVLLDAYWERNWAVKKVASEQYIKEVGGYTWLKNPVSGFYYELRYDKDRFSTLNQGTGVFIFDSWLARARLKGYNGQGQFHDETGASVANESRSREALKYGLNKLNEDLHLNVDFGIDTKVGKNYADVH